ncbi:MAG: stage V sporulation protein AC [Clostridiales bacterium]
MNDILKDSLAKELEKAQKISYEDLVKETKPKTPYFKNMLFAFLIGGLICAIGQICLEIFLFWGFTEKLGVTLSLITLIFLGALLTGLGLYDKIGKYAGAGSIVPISGFANSMVAPAMEWRSEGYILGLAVKIFTLAGPVIVYGICGSVILGLIKYIYWFIKGGW